MGSEGSGTVSHSSAQQPALPRAFFPWGVWGVGLSDPLIQLVIILLVGRGKGGGGGGLTSLAQGSICVEQNYSRGVCVHRGVYV